MTLPVSGNPISLANVNTELGKSYNATISLNDAAVRALAGESSGAISLANLFGKSSYNPGSVTSPTMPSGSYSDLESDSSYGEVAVWFNSDGTYFVRDSLNDTRASGNWTTAPASGVGANFNYVLTCSSHSGTAYTASKSGTLGSDLLIEVAARGTSTKGASSSASYSLVITEAKNSANTRTITFSLAASAISTSNL